MTNEHESTWQSLLDAPKVAYRNTLFAILVANLFKHSILHSGDGRPPQKKKIGEGLAHLIASVAGLSEPYSYATAFYRVNSFL